MELVKSLDFLCSVAASRFSIFIFPTYSSSISHTYSLVSHIHHLQIQHTSSSLVFGTLQSSPCLFASRLRTPGVFFPSISSSPPPLLPSPRPLDHSTLHILNDHDHDHDSFFFFPNSLISSLVQSHSSRLGSFSSFFLFLSLSFPFPFFFFSPPIVCWIATLLTLDYFIFYFLFFIFFLYLILPCIQHSSKKAGRFLESCKTYRRPPLRSLPDDRSVPELSQKLSRWITQTFGLADPSTWRNPLFESLSLGSSLTVHVPLQLLQIVPVHDRDRR